MFVLAELKNTIRITPDKFEQGLTEAVTNYMEKSLVGKVLKDVGYCIAMYDIMKMDPPFMLPGDGSAHIKVNFRVVVFRPFEEEVLIGKVARCTPDGVRVTMHFFDDITIPPSCLQQPCRFDQDENVWVWEYETEDGKHDMFMDIGEEIRFRVIRNTFHETNTADCNTQTDVNSPENETKKTRPYVITASVSEPGLGLLSWWA